MNSKEILGKYIKFYEDKGHKLIPNVSVVPDNDSTLLFVNSGMFPLVPYLSGEQHPAGKRLVNVQRSIRFEDLDNVGETNRHTTGFHMIGNWSLGDYFKDEQLPWAYEFLVEVLGLDINRLYATVFEGDEYAPKDEESIKIIKEIYKKYGIDAEEGERIFPLGKKDNWWKRGEAIGELGGPTSEIFYYIKKEGNGLGQNPGTNQDDFLEIGNSVFMQYRRIENGWEKLPQNNVDFGGGLERIALAVQGKQDIYETDNFQPIIEKIEEISGKSYGNDKKINKAMSVLSDHMRASIFMTMDGVTPSNKDQGYILRRLLRRMIRFAKTLGIEENVSVRLVDTVAENLEWLYPELPGKAEEIKTIFQDEEERFFKTLKSVSTKVKELVESYDGNHTELAKKSFDLYQSSGYPHEMLVDDIRETGKDFDQEMFLDEYKKLFEAHQDLSRKGAEQKFKGGLADQSEQVVKFHTATHLLHQALRDTLGVHISQQGSNITGDRLRFDFSHEEKLTDEEVKKVEDIINSKINDKMPVSFTILPREEAEKTGALHFFKEKYGDEVKVYFIGNSIDTAYSKEFCGGPHVKNTSEIGQVEIFKQESVGKGIRRIYLRAKT
jgi:alanyl-tRNA synthetase